MPIYEFIDTKTEKVHTVTMSIKEKEEYLARNEHIQSYFTQAPTLGDAVRLGLKKPDDGFKEVLSRVIEKTPGAIGLNDRLSRSTKRSM